MVSESIKFRDRRSWMYIGYICFILSAIPCRLMAIVFCQNIIAKLSPRNFEYEIVSAYFFFQHRTFPPSLTRISRSPYATITPPRCSPHLPGTTIIPSSPRFPNNPSRNVLGTLAVAKYNFRSPSLSHPAGTGVRPCGILSSSSRGTYSITSGFERRIEYTECEGKWYSLPPRGTRIGGLK